MGVVVGGEGVGPYFLVGGVPYHVTYFMMHIEVPWYDVQGEREGSGGGGGGYNNMSPIP